MTARTHVQHETSEQETADAVFPQLLPLPFMMPASGLYTYSSASLVPHIPISLPQNIPVPSRPTPPGPVELAEPEIDARVKEIGVRYDKLTFKYTGPWPPYNFVNIRLKLERAH